MRYIFNTNIAFLKRLPVNIVCRTKFNRVNLFLLYIKNEHRERLCHKFVKPNAVCALYLQIRCLLKVYKQVLRLPTHISENYIR